MLVRTLTKSQLLKELHDLTNMAVFSCLPTRSQQIIFAVLDRFAEEKRENYRTNVQNLMLCVQTAAIHGFSLRVVSAGSKHATFLLTQSELEKLTLNGVFIVEDR